MEDHNEKILKTAITLLFSSAQLSSADDNEDHKDIREFQKGQRKHHEEMAREEHKMYEEMDRER